MTATPATAPAAERPADPIDAHVAALAATLRGPARLRDRLLAELHAGLVDAARDLAGGRPYDPAAARRAVRDFGTVAELAPDFQRELTLAQARHTSCAVLLVVPVLLLCWYQLRVPGGAALVVGGIAAGAALPAGGFLALTGALGRWLPTPERLPRAVAWTGTVAAGALGLSALTLTAASVLAAEWPLTLAAALLTLACHTRLAASARTCRHCAYAAP